MLYRFIAPALAEYENSVLYYLTEASAETANAFVKEIEAMLWSICENPLAGKPVVIHARERVLDKFPFSIIYALEKEEIIVFAIKHHSREPEYWSNRLK